MNDNAGRLTHLLTPDKWEVQANGCWNWRKIYEANGGYGYIGTRKGGRSISAPAPRVALRVKLGRPIKPGHLACHTCDNPACVNPEHLYEGTPKENTQDMIRRGRTNDSHLKGGLATRKLTLDQTDEIRKRVSEGAYQADMAREYGVSFQVISDIVNGRHYRYGFAVPHKTARARRSLTDSQVREIRERVASGEKQAQVAKDFSTDSGTISRIVNGKLYRDVK